VEQGNGVRGSRDARVARDLGTFVRIAIAGPLAGVSRGGREHASGSFKNTSGSNLKITNGNDWNDGSALSLPRCPDPRETIRARR